jgi:3-phosphoshikimate 1-carboxyvinyltransferase
MAEIRLDRCDLSLREIEECFTSDVPLVATCRIADLIASEPSLQDEGLTPQSKEIKAAQIAEKRLCKAIEAGARYVDVEIEAPKQMSKRVRSVAHENGTVFIRSFHDFEGTDSLEALKAVVEKCCYHGADIVKVVTTAHCQEDVDRVLSLYDWCHGVSASENEKIASLDEGGLIAFCMGDAGRQSRLDCLRMGAPYTYAALSEDEAAAPGQWDAAEMASALYDGFHFIESSGTPEVPCSKSFAQRAIIAAALASGVSHLRGYTPCGDNEAAIRVAENLGAKVERNGGELTITGIAAGLEALQGVQTLHVGESGLLTRMMIPVMAQLCPSQVEFTGEKTLLERPLTGAREVMEALGATIASSGTNGNDEGASDPVRVPLTVKGPLTATRAEISGKHGSQIISGLLMALPFSQKNTSLIVREPKSIPYMFITVEVLKKFGIKIGNDMLGGRDFIESGGDWSLCTEIVFKVKGGQRFEAADIDLERDWSAAANFLVAGAIFGKVEMDGLDTTSLQADLSIMDILMDAGASLSQLDGDKGTITVQRAPLKAFAVDASNCPDLFPIISVLAAFCQGTSRIAGVGRLANKESDRAKAIVEMLTQMGVKASVEGDELVVEGHSLAQRLLAQGLLKGGEYTSHHDHRMVMALKVASLGADGPISIDDEVCVEKSFPDFLEMFSRLV